MTMIRPAHLGALWAFATVLAAPSVAHAHFILVSPAASLEQDDLGDPQKVPPCGDNGAGVATGQITVLQAGSTVTITIDETIPHPGHYRVAIAQTPEELPPEPPVTVGNTDCGSTTIMDPVALPILADGLFVHDAPFVEPQSIEVQLPADFTCENCTLQVLEFMSSHGAPCFYHHCAQVTIEGAGATESGPTTDDTASTTDDPTDPTDATASSEGGDESSAGSATSASGSASATATSSDDDSSGGTPTTLTTATDTASGGSDDDEDSGCGCTSTRATSTGWLALVVIGLLRGRTRRRS